MTPTEAVAASMLTAVHRRDHVHADRAEQECHPHTVEVVHLGSISIAVCHDCGWESGFDSVRSCERTASDHRHATVA